MNVSAAKVDFSPFGNTGVNNCVWMAAGVSHLPAFQLQHTGSAYDIISSGCLVVAVCSS